MASNIKGITIEIGGETKGLENALKGVDKQTKDLQKELKAVERGLKLDPGNVELVRQKQELLTQSISTTSERLGVLRGAQAQVQAQFDAGDLGADEYRAFQRELETTQGNLNRLQGALGGLDADQNRLAQSTRMLGTFFDATGTDVEQFAGTLGTRLTQAIRDGTASSDQIERAIRLMGQAALGSEVDIEALRAALQQIDDGGTIEDVQADLADLTDEADESGDAVNSFGQKLKGIAGTFAKVAAGVAIGVGAIGVAVLGLSAPLVSAAGDLEALNAQFEIVFGELEDTALKSLDAIGNETGVATGRLKGTFTQIAAFAKTSGASTAQALDLTSRATLAAADGAAFYDKSIEEVAESLQSFLKGNFANDAALGVSATEFTRNAVAADLFGKKFKDLTELQKQESLLKLVEDGNKLGGALGQAARETDGLENVLGNLDQAFLELKQAAGGLIFDYAISGLKSLTDFINGFDLQPFFDAFERIKEVITNLLAVVIPVIQERLAYLRELWATEGDGILTTITSVFDKIKEVIQRVLEVIVPFIQEQVAKIVDFWKSDGEQILEAVTTAFNGVKAVIDFIMPAALFVIQYIWDAIKNVITGALDIIIGVVKIFTGLLSGDFSKLWEGVKQLFSGAINFIIGLMSLSFVGGIRTLLTNLSKSAINIIKTKWTSIKALFTSFTSSIPRTVGQLYTKVIATFNNLRTNGVQIVKDLAMKLVNAIKGLPESFTNIGKDLIKGLLNGIKSIDVVLFIKGLFGNVVSVAKKILGIASPSKVFTAIGVNIGKSSADGISSTEGLNKKAITSLNKVVINEAKKNAKEVSEIAKKAEVERTAVQKKFAEQRTKAQTSYSNSATKTASATTKKTAKAIDAANKNYNAKVTKAATTRKTALTKISNDEQAALKKINDKAFADMQKKQAEVNKNTVESIRKYIKDKKDLNQLSLIDEAEYQRVAYKLAADGTDERAILLKDYQDTVSKINDSITSINENFVAKAQKINDDEIKGIEDQNKRYEDAYKSRYENLVDSYSLFEQVTKGELIEPRTLIDSLASQVDALLEFRNTISSLQGRGVSGALLEDLQNLGPKANDELDALNRLTSEQLTRYQELYQERASAARQIAVKELEPLKKDTEEQIKKLRETANFELDQLNKEWQAQIKKVIGGTEDQFKTLNQVGKNAAKNLLDGLSSMEGALLKRSKEIAQGISKTINDALNLGGSSGATITTGSNNIQSSSANLTRAVGNAQNSLNSSVSQSNANQVSRSATAQVNNIDMNALVNAISELSNRPIQTAVQIDGKTIANSVSGYQYNNTSLNALTRGVSI